MKLVLKIQAFYYITLCWLVNKSTYWHFLTCSVLSSPRTLHVAEYFNLPQQCCENIVSFTTLFANKFYYKLHITTQHASNTSSACQVVDIKKCSKHSWHVPSGHHMLTGGSNATSIHCVYSWMDYICIYTDYMAILTHHRFCWMMACICRWNGMMWLTIIIYCIN